MSLSFRLLRGAVTFVQIVIGGSGNMLIAGLISYTPLT
jgi:hypothetical protein